MLKLNTSYSKKVPVPGQDYSSQSYHASVEIELSDALAPDQIGERIRETFAMVRGAVERELNGGGAKGGNGGGVREVRGGKALGAPESDGAENARPASNRQIKYLTDLAAGQGIGVRELNARLGEKYGASSAYELTRRQASETIDALQQSKAA